MPKKKYTVKPPKKELLKKYWKRFEEIKNSFIRT